MLYLTASPDLLVKPQINLNISTILRYLCFLFQSLQFFPPLKLSIIPTVTWLKSQLTIECRTLLYYIDYIIFRWSYITGSAALQVQNFGAAATATPSAAATAINQPAVSGSSGGGAAGQPRQRVRARRGQATDPHSIAERVSIFMESYCTVQNQLPIFMFCFQFLSYFSATFVIFTGFSVFFFNIEMCRLKTKCVQLRRERIAERMKALQELVPNANKVTHTSPLSSSSNTYAN